MYVLVWIQKLEKALIYQGVKLGSKVKIGDNFIVIKMLLLAVTVFLRFTSLNSVGSLTNFDDDKKDKDESSVHVRVASLGSVHIGDNVEVGAVQQLLGVQFQVQD